MNKTLVAAIIAVLLLGGVGFAAMTMNSKNNDSTDLTTKTSETRDGLDNPASSNRAPADEATASPAATINNVEIKNSDYSQKKITVKVGTKVTWTNKDSMRHDVAPDQDYGDAFNASELLNKAETYSFTFTKAGTYNYHCTPHPFMKATVVVIE